MTALRAMPEKAYELAIVDPPYNVGANDGTFGRRSGEGYSKDRKYAPTPVRTDFKKYARQIVTNARVLAAELKRLGFKIISGGTDNHLMLVDVAPLGLTGKEAGERLERAGIVVNKNMIPYDTRKPWDPSGIRLGTPAVTTQGLKEKDMVRVARRIYKILMG